MRKSLGAVFSRFFRAHSANVAVTFSLAAVPMVGLIGGAVDYAATATSLTRMQAALDAAASAAVAETRDALNANISNTEAILRGQIHGQNLFKNASKTNITPSITITPGASGIQVSASASGSLPTTILGAVGISSIPFNLASKSSVGLGAYTDVYLLVDVSGSMLLPATPDGVNKMIWTTGCALACHWYSWGDGYAWARYYNVTLRYDVVKDGVQSLMSHLNTETSLRTMVRSALWSFDHALHENSMMTNNFTSVANSFPDPAMAVDDAAAATQFDNTIAGFVDKVGASGDGSSPSSPKKLVILASDGVNDPTRAWAWSGDPNVMRQVKAFDMKFCDTLKKRGVKVAIIHTPYLPMPGFYWYDIVLGQPGNHGGKTRVDDIPIVFKECAGDLYIQASSAADITAAFTKLFVKATTSNTIRYTQ